MTDGEPVDPSTAPGHDIKVVDRRWWAQENAAGAGQPADAPTKPSYVQALEQQLADKDALLADYAAKHAAAAREFEATRQRLRRDVAKETQRETRRVLATFLDVVDNLDRAIEASTAAASLQEGVEMVRQQFLGVLASHGVTPFDSAGEPFDPTCHDAVSTVPVSSPDQDNRVVEVIASGYRVDGDVLRPARVTVGAYAPGPR